MPNRIKDVALDMIDPNPYRNLATYPWVEAKIEHLMRSIQDVGLWESVIAREVQGRFETAFGHHRTEAARRLGLVTIPLIIRPLSDRGMLQFMGRENGEDYHSEFLTLLNTWEGAVRFCEAAASQTYKAIDFAIILGWTHPHASGRGTQMSATAAACAAAYELVRDKHLSRDDLRGLSVRDAREVVVVAHKEIDDLARRGTREKQDRHSTAQAQKIVSSSARDAAKDARAGTLPQAHIRDAVRRNIIRRSHGSPHRTKLLPLFAHFGAAVCKKIDNMLATDRSAAHIDEIAKVINQITMDEDLTVVRNLHHSLDELALRAGRAKRRTTPNKVVKLQAITGDVP